MENIHKIHWYIYMYVYIYSYMVYKRVSGSSPSPRLLVALRAAEEDGRDGAAEAEAEDHHQDEELQGVLQYV